MGDKNKHTLLIQYIHINIKIKIKINFFLQHDADNIGLFVVHIACIDSAPVIVVDGRSKHMPLPL